MMKINDLFKKTINLNALDELSIEDFKKISKIFQIAIDDLEKNDGGEESTIIDVDGTDSTVTTKGRKEQEKLRKYLFEDRNTSLCALCRRRFPVDLLVAAHIKPRKYCSEHERKDLKIVMPLCKICDVLYEKDYLQVNEDGSFIKNTYRNFSKDLIELFDEYFKDQKYCSFYNEDTKKYFREKRKIFNEKVTKKLQS